MKIDHWVCDFCGGKSQIEALIKRTDGVTNKIYYICSLCNTGFIFEDTLLSGKGK